MKFIIRIFKLILGSLLLVVVIFFTYMSVKYSPVYVYRLITQNVADVYDYGYYQNRDIKGSESTNHFAKNIDEEYVESLFHDRVIQSGCTNFEDWAIKSKTTSLIFIRRDTIIYEKYFNGFNRDSYFHSQSMAKSFVSFLIGAAIDDSLISSVGDPMTNYIPELKDRDVRFEKITINDLLEMRSGIKYNEDRIPGINIHTPWHDEAVGYYLPDVRSWLLEEVEIERESGKFQYCNYNTSYLGLIIERATGMSVSEYLEKKLWSKIMEYDALFSIDSEESGFEYMPSRLIARAIDFARFGRLYLNEGIWNNDTIISSDWVRNSTSLDKLDDTDEYPFWMGMGCNRTYYGYQWWGHWNCDSSYQFFASGNLGQTIYVIPEKEIIIVHTGNSNEYFSDYDLCHVNNCINYNEFNQLLNSKGVKNVLRDYQSDQVNDLDYMPFSEKFIMDKGYAFLNAGKIDEAKALFSFNCATFPESWNVYNNLAEAFQREGKIDSAVYYYKKSLSIKPDKNWAKGKLETLQ
jgi:CubicO group peptidase (beta-lactamase class C family)